MRRSVLGLGAVIAALALVAVVTLVLTARAPATYPAGSPEASFQAYLQAWEADDLDAAYATFSDGLRSKVSRDEYRSMANGYDWARAGDRRVVLVASTIAGDRATLDLRIDQFSNGPAGGDVWSTETRVRLVREAGVWHIDELLAGLEPMWYEQ